MPIVSGGGVWSSPTPEPGTSEPAPSSAKTTESEPKTTEPTEPKEKILGIGADPETEDEPDKSEKKPEKKSEKKPEKSKQEKEAEKKPRVRKIKLGDVEFDHEDDEADEIDLGSKTVTLKVNGKEVEVPINRLTRDYQLAASSYEKHEQAAQRTKQFTQAVEALKGDHSKLRDFLQHQLGIENPTSFAEDELMEKARLERLASGTLEQRAEYRRTVEEQAQQRAQAQARQAAERQQAQMRQQQEQEAQQRYLQGIRTKRGEMGLHDSIGLGALQLMEARFQGMGRDPRNELDAFLSETRDIVADDIRARLGQMSTEALAELLGPQLKKLNDWQLKKLRSSNTRNNPPPKEEKKPDKPPPPRRRYTSIRQIEKGFED